MYKILKEDEGETNNYKEKVKSAEQFTKLQDSLHK